MNAATNGELLGLLRELREYVVKLERASAAWFATRSFAKHPEAGDLGTRLDAVLGPYQEDDEYAAR